MTSNNTEIAVIGAGITGLTLAYWLQKAGKKVVVLEKSDHCGGVINTENAGGFTYETGPNTGVIANEELVRLFESLDGKIVVEKPDPSSKNRLILKQGKWVGLPSGVLSGITSPLFTLGDKLRLLGEPFRRKGKNPDETVADMVIRRMGKSFLEYAVDPFISGIYAGDPHKLITRHALPKLFALEQNYGSFIKGAVIKGSQPKTELEKKVTREIFSVKGGLKKLINILGEETGHQNIHLNAANIVVMPYDGSFNCIYSQNGNIHQLIARSVISTVSSMNIPGLFPFIGEEMTGSITNLEYARIIQVVACYRNWKGIPLNAFGGLIPSSEQRDILGILFPASIFAERAPVNGAVLSVFMGGVRKPEMLLKSDEEIKKTALEEIQDTLKFSGYPDIFKIYRYEHAIPQYGISTGRRLMAIDAIESKYPGLILAGNIRDGIGIADRVKQSVRIAEKIISGS